MIIKSIQLENFRQYKGKQPPIEFSTDPERNVSVVLGINTSGKTTIVQAFTWCLYESTSFKKKDMLLNSEVAQDLAPNSNASVRVEVVLVHEDKEYSIVRSQKFTRLYNGNIGADRASLSVSYKEPNGNTYYINAQALQSTINNILPEGLSDYFFFDGERIQEINTKKDVVAAVRGLMGLDIINAAVDHLNPDKQGSVINSLQKSLVSESDSESQRLQKRLIDEENNKAEASRRLDTTISEIESAKHEQKRLSDKLNETEKSRRRREDTLRYIEGQKYSLKMAQEKLMQDFNRDYFAYFAKPIMIKAMNVISNSSKQIIGIPKMHSESIEYILKRGKCICGCDLTKNQGAVENIQYECSLLPPHHIGTDIADFNNTCKALLGSYYNDLSKIVLDDFQEIRRLERSIDSYETELKDISTEIKKVGTVNAAEIENDYQRNENSLNTLVRRQGSLEQEIRGLDNTIDSLKRSIDSMAIQCGKNDLIRREIAYAKAVYEWFKVTYDRQEKSVKEELLHSVNKIFDEMYHGTRDVSLDDKYRIILTASVGANKVDTEESRGLEAVKNFAFISGLVDLARKKARKVDDKAEGTGDELYSTEPYPIIMDAPFSDLDEVHIKNISTIVPTIAEQVILIVMEKDWSYAKQTMGDRVGASYRIRKVDNSDTSSIVEPVQL